MHAYHYIAPGAGQIVSTNSEFFTPQISSIKYSTMYTGGLIVTISEQVIGTTEQIAIVTKDRIFYDVSEFPAALTAEYIADIALISAQVTAMSITTVEQSADPSALPEAQPGKLAGLGSCPTQHGLM